jgi:hypothetical protein
MNASAQSPTPALHSSFTDGVEALMLRDTLLSHHTAIRPFNPFEVGHFRDSLHESLRFNKDIDKKFTRWLFNVAFNDHFAEVRDKKNDRYWLAFNPLVDFRFGNASDNDNLAYVNSRGLQVMGRLGRSVTFYSDLYENQARFPKYVDDWIDKNLVVPGEGYPKVFDSQLSEINARDFAYATGQVTYQPNEIFNFQLGHGKHFIGEGHRSLLLSDNAFNYPYFRIKTSFWKLSYMNLFTQMSDFEENRYGAFEKKYVSTHYLSINATKNFNIGLFESVVYQDSTGRFDANFLNPIILYRPVEFAVGSGKGNVLIGIHASYKIKDKNMFYFQAMFDEFKFDHILKTDGWWANKFAFQLGFKAFDAFTSGLKLRTELNYARPYTYSHHTTGRNYGQYNQALAHPLGANFIESVNMVSYQKGRWFGELELMYVLQGRDTLGSNWGSDVFLSYDTREQEFDNKTLQGVKSKTFFVDLRTGYLINPRTNLRAEVGLTYRRFSPEVTTVDLEPLNTTYFHVGIRTALNNKYYDF